MAKVFYYYFGGQCPGCDFMGAMAEAAAKLLGRDYEAVDITHRPDLAARHSLFFPDTIIIDDFAIPFPSRPKQIVELFRRRGPLDGEQSYSPKPSGALDGAVWLNPAMAAGVSAVCVDPPPEAGVAGKRAFFETMARKAPAGALGMVGTTGGRVVAVAEFLPETEVPYPIPHKRPDGAFITCLYGVDADVDHRLVLLRYHCDTARLMRNQLLGLSDLLLRTH